MIGYMDTSAIVSLAFDDEDAERVVRALQGVSRLVSSNLLEAELRSARNRRGFAFPDALVSALHWIHPRRPLTGEFRVATRAGSLRGADLWHVASALYLSPTASDLAFVTMDFDQAKVAARLGFLVLPTLGTPCT
ncbi:MAG: PIN domain-containing protein [Gemmatimonadetes bacterium]|nr:PIN domain-containing protein [Gemmatimonadota bacterium]